MMVKFSLKALKDVFARAILSGCGSDRLTRSFCIGLYIAFSPFPGVHAVIMIASKYFFNLHFPTLFIATSINNPWTMIPFYSFDYAFGYWLVHSLLGWEPSWVISLERLFGSGQICLWSFFLGGNVIGLIAALVGYPIMKIIFKRFADNGKQHVVLNDHCSEKMI